VSSSSQNNSEPKESPPLPALGKPTAEVLTGVKTAPMPNTVKVPLPIQNPEVASIPETPVAQVPTPVMRPRQHWCEEDEYIVLNCKVSDNIRSLCKKKNPPNNLVYRRGGEGGDLRWTYPDTSKEQSADFSYAEKESGVTKNKTVMFSADGKNYHVYVNETKRFGNDGVESIVEDGLKVFKEGKLTEHLTCDEGSRGFWHKPF